MQVIREFREIDSDEIVIKIPHSFTEKKVEIIVLPTATPPHHKSSSKEYSINYIQMLREEKRFQ